MRRRSGSSSRRRRRRTKRNRLITNFKTVGTYIHTSGKCSVALETVFFTLTSTHYMLLHVTHLGVTYRKHILG